MSYRGTPLRLQAAVGLGCLLAVVQAATAAAVDAARLLPPETSLVICAPDFPQAVAAFTNQPLSRLWRDAAMQGAATRFATWWQDEISVPLQKQWHFTPGDLLRVVHGQVFFATLPDPDGQRGWIWLLDAGERAAPMTNLVSQFRRQWTEQGKPIRTESLEGYEVLVVSLPETPGSRDLKSLFHTHRAFDESLVPSVTKPALTSPVELPARPPERELFIAQAGSRLVLASGVKALGAVLRRLDRSDLPVLAERADFAQPDPARFRSGQIWAWAEGQSFLEFTGLAMSTNLIPAETLAANPEAALFLSPALGPLARAAGLGAVQTMQGTLRQDREGTLFELHLTSRRADSKRLLDALRGPSADLAPAPSVPASALACDRIRWSAGDLPGALRLALDEFSPRFAGAVDFLLETADEAAKQRDPGFNLREHLQAGLGEELVTWEREVTLSATQTVRRVIFLPSPQPDRLARALKALFILFPQQEGDATERELLGRTLFSIPLPPLPGSHPGTRSPGTLHYTATQAGVVMSTSEALVEEFLRTGGSATSPLRDQPRVAESLARVTDSGTRASGYWNDLCTARTAWEAWRASPDNGAALAPFTPLPRLLADAVFESATLPPLAAGANLPPFEVVARFFQFSVYGLSTPSNGLTLRYFVPEPEPANTR